MRWDGGGTEQKHGVGPARGSRGLACVRRRRERRRRAARDHRCRCALPRGPADRKSTRLNSSHGYISYAVFCLKKKKKEDVVQDARLNWKRESIYDCDAVTTM